VRTSADRLKMLDYALGELMMHENSLQRVREFCRLDEAYGRVFDDGAFEERLKAVERQITAWGRGERLEEALSADGPGSNGRELVAVG
jgi:hypothetical protein